MRQETWHNVCWLVIQVEGHVKNLGEMKQPLAQVFGVDLPYHFDVLALEMSILSNSNKQPYQAGQMYMCVHYYISNSICKRLDWYAE